MSIKGIIFDYGGTLDNAGDHWGVTLRDILGAVLHKEIPVDIFCRAYIRAEREMAQSRQVLPEHTFRNTIEIKAALELNALADEGFGLDISKKEEYTAAIAELADARARSCIDTARPVLERLATRMPLALVSNFYGNIATVLRDYGIAGCFHAVIESAAVGIRKPDPAIFRLGAEAIGLEPADVLVVGDSIGKDIRPAQSIGFSTAWLEGKPWFFDNPVPPSGLRIRSIEELESYIHIY